MVFNEKTIQLQKKLHQKARIIFDDIEMNED